MGKKELQSKKNMYIYTKEPCLATKGTPIIRVTLDKEKKHIREEKKIRKKTEKRKEKRRKKSLWAKEKKIENEGKSEKKRKNIQNIKRAIWPNYTEHS